ncbi:hypothetical protein [Sphingobium estronivorans]|uniref:hypothetical protein n=1 Tax=Sphingobium estronivorans TaxID=1577690 RepID=UPI00123A2DAA|nr:hypothetical protein [Sphingobium estronivorans]
MAKAASDTRSIEQTLNGLSIDVWNKKWVHVPDGFRSLQSDLRRRVGVFAARDGDEVKYVGCATQLKNGGLRAGLARVRLKLQTNNSSYGILKIKENIDAVEAYVIFTEDPLHYVIDAKNLAVAMIDLHNPSWNAPRYITAAARKARYGGGS